MTTPHNERVEENPRCRKCNEITIKWYNRQVLTCYHCSYCGTDMPCIASAKNDEPCLCGKGDPRKTETLNVKEPATHSPTECKSVTDVEVLAKIAKDWLRESDQTVQAMVHTLLQTFATECEARGREEGRKNGLRQALELVIKNDPQSGKPTSNVYWGSTLREAIIKTLTPPTV